MESTIKWQTGDPKEEGWYLATCKETTMTEEQKQLLIKDLCGRLPYGVNILHVKDGIIGVLSNINIYVEGREQKLKCSTPFFGEDDVPIEEFKPYLYPLSSMTDKQKEELDRMFELDMDVAVDCIRNGTSNVVSGLNRLDWLNKHHFDYRGLIKQGLAIDARSVIMYNEEK